MRVSPRPRPELDYRVMKTFVRGDQAVLLVQVASNNFFSMTLRKEDGQWKAQDQFFRNTAPDANSVYALIPPDPGAFARAGSHWDQVAAPVYTSQAAHLGWEIKAIFDEAYLYIR